MSNDFAKTFRFASFNKVNDHKIRKFQKIPNHPDWLKID